MTFLCSILQSGDAGTHWTSFFWWIDHVGFCTSPHDQLKHWQQLGFLAHINAAMHPVPILWRCTFQQEACSHQQHHLYITCAVFPLLFASSLRVPCVKHSVTQKKGHSHYNFACRKYLKQNSCNHLSWDASLKLEEELEAGPPSCS